MRESKNTLYTWYRTRAELTKLFLEEKKRARKQKSAGSGRKPMAAMAEAAVKVYITERRDYPFVSFHIPEHAVANDRLYPSRSY